MGNTKETPHNNQILSLSCRYYRVVPVENPDGYIETTLSLDTAHTALLLVDVYGLGFDPNYHYGSVNEFYKHYIDICREIIIDKIKPSKTAAQEIGLPTIYLSNYLAPSTTTKNTWRQMSIRTCGVDVLQVWKPPSDVLAYSEIIAPTENDFQIYKQHYSGFFETQLESLLKELDIKNLIMVGFDSLICLHSTALDALYRNYNVIVLRDSTTTTEHQETQSDRMMQWVAIRFIETNVGYTSTAMEFISACHEICS